MKQVDIWFMRAQIFDFKPPSRPRKPRSPQKPRRRRKWLICRNCR